MHILKQERSKLDDRIEKFIFISYDENSKGYKLYNPNNRKIVTSKDIEFDQEKAWDWSSQKEGPYDFLPYFDNEEPIVQEVEATSPASPHAASPGSSLIISPSSSSNTEPRKYQCLDDIYNKT